MADRDGFLSYDLLEGFVSNWLVAGPITEAAEGSPRPWDDTIGIEGAPIERGPLDSGQFRAGGLTGVWTYLACPEDHAIDHSATYAVATVVRAWAYAELESDAPRAVTFTVTSDTRFGLWLNDTSMLRNQQGVRRIGVELPAGVTRVMIRTEQVTAGAAPHALTLRVDPAVGVQVRLPTLIAGLGRRSAFETLSAGVYLDRDVYAGDTPIILRWPDGERALCAIHVRLHGPDESIYALADKPGQPGDSVHLGFAMQLPAGPMHVTLMPTPDEVYLENIRIDRRLAFWSMGRRTYAARAPGSSGDRRSEALLAIAEIQESALAQIARMALGAWSDLDATLLVNSLQQPTTDVLLACVGMLYRFGAAASFPAEVRHSLENAVLTFSRWEDTLVSAAAEVLSGQQWPDSMWADGHSGVWHRARAEAYVLESMHKFGQFGSTCPGSALELHDATAALSHIADLADEPRVYELAAVCADKVLFMLALHSRHGAFGAASSHCPPSFVKSGYLQATAGISRLLWGSGIYNDYALGPLSLACNTAYEPPPVLESIAHDAPEAQWSQERHAPPDAEPIDIVAYRTPEYVLSSLRGVTPGRPGRGEVMWRATLGPEAIVFANQPGSSSENDARIPGYWAGNLHLPFVVQWHDVAFAMHRLASSDVFGFTHAYFPVAAFDEYGLREGWAFARVGAAFVALTNTAGVTLTREGRYAFRELRAFGSEQTWIVQMGRSVLDGSFADFQTAVGATHVESGAGGLRYRSIRGQHLAFQWGEALLVDGAVAPGHGEKHFQNSYTSADLPCEIMEIRHGPEYLRLDFSPG